MLGSGTMMQRLNWMVFCQPFLKQKKHCKKQIYRDIEEAFLQARSYARLLLSQIIVLCDRYCLLVYKSNDGVFDRSRYEKYYWGDLKRVELFNKLKKDLS